jgi:hypothetical protein
VLIGIQLVSDIEFDIAEEVKVGAFGLVGFQGFENGLRRMALMHEQRQRRDADLLPFRLARPIQEGLCQAAKTGYALSDRGKALFRSLPNLFGESAALPFLDRFRDKVEQPFRKGALCALILAQFGGQA